MLLRFLPQRRWVHPGRPSMSQEVRKHMEQDMYEGNKVDEEDRMPRRFMKTASKKLGL